jgi:hypothetical protein
MRVQAAASSRARGWLAAQAAAWAEGGFAEHLQADRWAAYQLLAGRIDAVAPVLALGWRRALGLHFWCACAQPRAIEVKSNSHTIAPQLDGRPVGGPLLPRHRSGCRC